MQSSSTAHHRTCTRDQLVFELRYPEPVIYDFSNLETDGLKITVPPHSTWRSDSHWHYTPEACEYITMVTGHFYFYHSNITLPRSGLSFRESHPGVHFPVSPQRKFYWHRDYEPGKDPSNPIYPTEPTVVCYKFKSLNAYEFYRQVCSVNQDAEEYFHLSSTPLWLRILYASWRFIPVFGKKFRAWLLACCLWIQLRVIYAKNDYWTDDGYIPYTWLWYWYPLGEAPAKWWKKQTDSVVLILRRVRRSCYWIGTRMLGMKESYAEYEPVEQRHSDGEEEKENLIKL